MNDAVRVPTDGFLTTADLAGRPDFTLGLALVSPSSRSIAGPGGATLVEPRVMQVLVVLADAAGQVVTRGTLFDRCWGGVYVGDDSLNRTIGAIRKLAADIAGGSFEVETIPRTGYRLTGEIAGMLDRAEGEDAGPRVSRRGLIGAGAAGAAILGGAGLWWTLRPGETFEDIMAQGDEAFRNGTAFEGGIVRNRRSRTMADLYEEAVLLRPDSARAWGLLAYYRSAAADSAPAESSEGLTQDAQVAIRRAFSLDASEPNARIAMFLLEGGMLDWMERDRQLRNILKTDPNNLLAMMELMPLLQAAGLTRESWMWNERILAASPFARGFLVVRALKLWIIGRMRDSDSVIDRVRGLWPDFQFGYQVRFMLFALTGRPRAAMAMLESAPKRIGSPAEVSMWRAALTALDSRASADIEAARLACVDTARKFPPVVNDTIMLLGSLGLKDTAFEATEGFLLWRGKIVSSNQANGKEMDDYSRRMTQWLFTPPLAEMRKDPRFEKLCDEFGLTAYWRARHVRPDYRVYG